MSQIKITRARKSSAIGANPETFAAMLAYVPTDVVNSLTSKLLAAQIDAIWQACGASKMIASREAIENGAVYANGNTYDLTKRPAV